MKRAICLILVMVLAITALSMTTAFAQSDTLVIETRTGSYTYHVGDKFTYTFWLDIEPELVDYIYDLAISEDPESIKQVIRDAEEIEDTQSLLVKTLNGYIGYDPDLVTLLSYEVPEKEAFPELAKTRFAQINDPLGQTIVGGSVLDFFKDGLSFAYPDPAGFSQGKNTEAFQKCRRFFKCTFYVAAGSDEPMYMRAKLRDLDVVTDSGTEVKLIDDGQANFCNVVTYETFDDEEPSLFPSTIVDEVAFDVRFLDSTGSGVVNLRPGPGAQVNMYGVTADGRYVHFAQAISGEEIVNHLTGGYGQKIVKFYDIPYGQYHVDCTYIDDQGNYYATPDSKQSELVNVPMSGATQALWLVSVDQQIYSRMYINVEWVGDHGSLSERPTYLLAELVDGSSTVLTHVINKDVDREQLDCVELYDDSGNIIDYTLKITPVVADGVVPYTIDVARAGDNEFTVTCTYLGDESSLVYPDENGHYWETYNKLPRVEPTCTEEGYYFEYCVECRCMKRIALAPLGHDYIDGQREPTCTEDGYIGMLCSRCGAADPSDEDGIVIDALGHNYSTEWTIDIQPSCLIGGYKSHHCARCDSKIDTTYIAPLGHDFQLVNDKEPGCRTEGYTGDVACTRCQMVLSKGKVIPPKGHSGELTGYKAPTCTLSGYSGDTVCTQCNMVLSHGSVTPPTGHDYSEVINAIAATCTDDGYTGDTVCKNCGKLEHKGETIPAIGHDFKITSEKPSTNTEAGYIIYTCSHCGQQKTKTLYPGCPSTVFYDVDTNAWYHEAIDFVLNHDIMHGVSEHSFCPDNPLTRAMLVTIIYNYSGEPKASGTSPFPDVADDAWYADCVIWAYENKIVSGYDDGTFKPDNYINREELVTVLNNYYAEYLGRDGRAGSVVLSKYADAKTISTWAYKPFRWAVGNDLVHGTSETTLEPKKTATRAETANIIMALDTLVRKSS